MMDMMLMKFLPNLSQKYCEKILPLLNINAISNLKEFLEKLSNNSDMIPRVGEWGNYLLNV
jgi:hypothetical protein